MTFDYKRPSRKEVLHPDWVLQHSGRHDPRAAKFNSGVYSCYTRRTYKIMTNIAAWVCRVNNDFFSSFQSSGYCWCVDPMNGHPIPGTSKHGSRPNCGEDVGAVIMRQAKPWRKCPDHRRRQFRERLLDKLTREMVGEMSEAAFAPSRFLDARLTVEERVAKWKFTALDSNKNGVREGERGERGSPALALWMLNVNNIMTFVDRCYRVESWGPSERSSRPTEDWSCAGNGCW